MVERVILVTGSRGFIGSSFIEAVSLNRDYRYICPTHKEMDVSEYSSVERVLGECRPDTIINFAAHRNANTAEEQKGSEEGSAWRTNVIGTRNLAQLCAERQIHLVHISTDMVFSGDKTRRGPYLESDPPEDDLLKLSWYGWTKRLAEREIMSRGSNASIVRIGNVTKPTSEPQLDYIAKVLWLFDHGYSVFENQYITLSRITELIQVILKLVEGSIGGVFHVASTDVVTPLQLVQHVVYQVRSSSAVVKSSSIDDYLRDYPNRYPKYGGLDSRNTQSRLGLSFMAWREAVSDFINNA